MTTLPVAIPTPTLVHLSRLTNHWGIAEHAYLAAPRPEANYCTDDAGRLLALSSRLADDAHAPRLARNALHFLTRAHLDGSAFLLRHDAAGTWSSDVSDDASARALLGLASAAAFAPWPDVRRGALALFDECVGFTSDHLRASAYATLAAATLLMEVPDHEGARTLLSNAPPLVVSNLNDPWPWPESRLTYANALLPYAELARAAVRHDSVAARHALEVLEWLVTEETLDDHFSFTPVAGRGRGDERPAFDQQPIEAFATAEACAFAYEYSGDEKWLDAATRAGSWFLGNNDVGAAVFDPQSGGGFDGLESSGVNRNQGAESTLAFVATMRELSELEHRSGQPTRWRDESLYATSRSASSK